MKREIKFRAWSKLKNEMISDYCIHENTNFIGYDLTNNQHEIVDVMEFTGLIDKNGKEIYEGDLLKDTEFDDYDFDISKCYAVVYDSKTAQWCIDNSFAQDGSHLVNIVSYFGINNLEVVGNIHEDNF